MKWSAPGKRPGDDAPRLRHVVAGVVDSRGKRKWELHVI